MANLIPPAAKKDILVEYWVRVTSVWFVLLGMAALTLAVLNVPVYVLIQNQLQTYSALYSDASEQNTSFEKIENEIKVANNIAALLVKIREVNGLTPYVEQIQSFVNKEISITSFDMVRVEGVPAGVNISGVADNRQSLVAFSQAIEASEDFKSAEIPLSNLAKDSNIPFTVTAVLESKPK
jgi:hypothetical protein